MTLLVIIDFSLQMIFFNPLYSTTVSDAIKMIFKYHHSFSRYQSMSNDEHDGLCFSVNEMIIEQQRVCFIANDLILILGRLAA